MAMQCVSEQVSDHGAERCIEELVTLPALLRYRVDSSKGSEREGCDASSLCTLASDCTSMTCGNEPSTPSSIGGSLRRERQVSNSSWVSSSSGSSWLSSSRLDVFSCFDDDLYNPAGLSCHSDDSALGQGFVSSIADLFHIPDKNSEDDQSSILASHGVVGAQVSRLQVDPQSLKAIHRQKKPLEHRRRGSTNCGAGVAALLGGLAEHVCDPFACFDDDLDNCVAHVA